MQFQYPITLTNDEDTVVAQIVDIPEAITFGDDKEHALHEAQML